MFIDRLIEKVKEKNNPTVVGLDPKLEYVPGFIKDKALKEHGSGFKGASEAILEFNKKIIDAVYDIVPAVKPQLAYYEMYGVHGLNAFCETVKYCKSKGMLVIADGKRNDIGTTAQAYSSAYLGFTETSEDAQEEAFGADALTVNAYLGADGIRPFIDDCSKYGKGIFILVKTSNKSSGQIQDLTTQDGRKIYEAVADLVNEWGEEQVGRYGYSNVGAVVGATYPEQAKILRKRLKHAYILVPGYGAQGGSAKDAANSFNDDGLGAIINASRSIMCAYMSEMWRNTFSEARFDEACRAEAVRMREDILKAIGK
ncbi:MAG: orotidine-5'-phosphate decarboxylase [Clostridia bacterium]|nr:orotidine-5'-phosphate decarboxylase [Clostridia bacterium]